MLVQGFRSACWARNGIPDRRNHVQMEKDVIFSKAVAAQGSLPLISKFAQCQSFLSTYCGPGPALSTLEALYFILSITFNGGGSRLQRMTGHALTPDISPAPEPEFFPSRLRCLQNEST